MPVFKNMESQQVRQLVLAGVVGAASVLIVLGMIGYALSRSPQIARAVSQFIDARVRAQGIVPVADSSGQTSPVVSVVEKTNPAVVSIIITKEVPKLESYNPFSFMVPQYRQNGTEQREVGGGSGFIVSADGYIVTNAHVVSDTEATYTVFLNDGSSQVAKVIATDTILDIAVLKIDGHALAYLEFGDSSTLKVGQTVIAIGNALGEFRNTVSVGVVSGLSRSIVAAKGMGETERLADVIQTDAAINPGNSGGPLLDLSGRVVGINVAASVGGSENIGFALPADLVASTVESIKTTGKISRPYMGIHYFPIDADFAAANALSVDYGALLRRDDSGALAVIPGSPADKAGLEENDIIIEINGQKVDWEHPLANTLRSLAVGQTVSLKVLHDGQEKTVSVTLGELPTEVK